MKYALLFIFAVICTLPLQAQEKNAGKPEEAAPPGEDMVKRPEMTTGEIEAAIKALSSRFVEERKEARKKLIQVGKKAVEPLVLHLGSELAPQRAAAAEILGHIGEIEAAPALAGLFKDRDFSVRDAARNALARIGPDAVKHLENLLEGSEADKEYFSLTVRKMVRNSIRSLVLRSPDGEEEFGDYPGQFKELAKIGRHAVAHLAALVKKSDLYSDRYLAVVALGRLGDKSAVPVLKEIFEAEAKLPEEERRLYDDAAISLTQLGDESALGKVVQDYTLAMIKSPEDYQIPANLALLYHKMEKWDKAEEFYKRAIEVEPENSGAYYNYACLLAVRKRIKEAMTILTKSVENGYTSGAWIMRDGELDNLRELPEFKELVQKNYGKTPGAE